MGEAKIKLDLENSIPAIFGQQITLLVVPLNIIVFLYRMQQYIMKNAYQ